jgi:hypothetical protein
VFDNKKIDDVKKQEKKKVNKSVYNYEYKERNRKVSVGVTLVLYLIGFLLLSYMKCMKCKALLSLIFSH